MRQVLLASAVLGCALALATPRARAGGLEYAGQGAQALGRGGAVTARADDPMVLSYNPAGLAELRGSQLMFNANLALMHACYDPAGYYGWGVYLGGQQNAQLRDQLTGETRTLHFADSQAATETYYSDPLDTVCMKEHVTPIPQLAWTARLSEKLGIGAGLIFPAVTPSGAWGGPSGSIHGKSGELRPAPSRYMLLDSANLGVFPTVGIGYRLLDRVRIGGAFEWGIIAVNNYTMASSNGGTTPTFDIVAHTKAQDWFIPAFTASVHFVPIDSIDIVGAFRWQDDLKAKGDIDLTTGIFDPKLVPYTTGQLPISSLTQHMPWKIRGGIRYADRFAPRPRGSGSSEADPASPEVIHDALQDERFDVEIDAEYELNSRNDQQVLTYPLQNVLFKSADPSKPISMAMAPTRTVIEKHWKDQLSLQAGGTFNVVPGKFGLSAGVHWENRGIDPSYMQIDFWPVSRLGLHGGVIVRVAKAIDLVASFAHIFQETIIAEPPPDQDRGVIASCYAGTAQDPSVCLAPPGKIGAIDKSAGPLLSRGMNPPKLEAPSQGTPDGRAKLQQQLTTSAANQPPYIINSGRYRSNIDVIAAGINVHF